MDADALARELLDNAEECAVAHPTTRKVCRERSPGCECRNRIAAALRRARAAGRREAVEECARVAYAAGCDNPLCLLCVGHGLAAKIRALAAGAGEQKEGEG